jgi:dephospho-CoA kinase
MIKIGIVGDIGSGKSYVAKQFGLPIFNADLEVRKIYKKNEKCFKKLKKIFPKHIFSFPVKRKELFEAVLENKNNVKKINKIVHPEVRLLMNKFLNKNKKKKGIVLDIPLLLEGKINKKNDILVFVEAKKKEINKRLKKRQYFKKKIFERLRKLQLPLETKREKSNFIIINNFKSLSTKKNVKILKKKIFKNERSNIRYRNNRT